MEYCPVELSDYVTRREKIFIPDFSIFVDFLVGFL